MKLIGQKNTSETNQSKYFWEKKGKDADVILERSFLFFREISLEGHYFFAAHFYYFKA